MAVKPPPAPPWTGALKALRELIVASMQRRKYECISPEVLRRHIETGQPLTVVDCRDSKTFAAVGHIPGAINVPHDTFMKTCRRVPINNPIVAVCYKGYYSRAAAQKLGVNGHAPAWSLSGGMEAWIVAGYPIETTSS